MSGATLGRYTIIRELARSNDIVYEAMDPQGRKIALKELQMPGNLAGQARRDRIERFRREARAAHSLKHTNVVRIHDFGEAEGRHYIAMEFLEGQSLRDVLRQRKVLPLNEALRITAAVADGLQFAHQNRVVHRDVKPDNVHLEPDGRVVITDFGIARLTFEATLTADGQIFGTPSYMSPEQVTGKEIDARSDLFSLGVMLYEMVTGRKPFTGDSVVTVTYNIMNQDPSPSGTSPELERILRYAMAKDRALRYRSAAEMAEDLRLVAKGLPPKHAPVQLPGRSVMAPPVPQQRPAAPPPSAPVHRPAAGPPPRVAGPPPTAGPGMMAPAAAGAGYAVPAMSYPGARPVAGPPGMAPPAYQTPHGIAPPAGPVPQQKGGWDFRWLAGVFGVTVVVGVIIFLMIFAGITATETIRKNAAIKVLNQKRAEAMRLCKQMEAILQEQNDRRSKGMSVDQKRVEEADGLARKALDARPEFSSALLGLARAYSLRGTAGFQSALELFQRTIDRDGASDLPAEERKAAHDNALNARIWRIDAIYNEGLTQAKAGNYDAARQRYNEVVSEVDQFPKPTEELIRYRLYASDEVRKLPAASQPAAAGGVDNGSPAVAEATTPPTPSVGTTGTSPAGSPQPNPATSIPPPPPAPSMPNSTPGAGDNGPYRPPNWSDAATGNGWDRDMHRQRGGQ